MNTIGEIIKNKDLETYKKLEEMVEPNKVKQIEKD